MYSPRERALRAVKVGNVVFGITESGKGRMLLVYKATDRKIFARHIPSTTRAEFWRDGKSQWCQGGGTCVIVSTASLPTDQHELALGLDRKMRAAKDLADYRLSQAEIQLLRSADDFFTARPLPAT